MWCDESDGTSSDAEVQTALHKTCCEIGLGEEMLCLTVIHEVIVLSVAPQVRHIRCNESELTGKNFSRLGQAACRHGHFVRGVVLGFLRQRLFQQRLEFMEIRLD